MTEEFFKQGDTERQFGMPISPLCDRHNSRFERSQIGFLEFVVLPLYSAVREVLALADFDTVLDRIQHNMAVWKQLAEQAERPEAGPSPPSTRSAPPMVADASTGSATAAAVHMTRSPAMISTTPPSPLKIVRANTIQEQSEDDDVDHISSASALENGSGAPPDVVVSDAGLPDVLRVVVTSNVASFGARRQGGGG